MDVSALRAHVAAAGRVRPIEPEKTRGGSVELRFTFPKSVVTAHEALQLAALHLNADRIGFEETHKFVLSLVSSVFDGASLPIALRSAGTCSSNFSNFTPVRLSRTGGNCAMICVTSPVSLLAPPPGPLPEL